MVGDFGDVLVDAHGGPGPDYAVEVIADVFGRECVVECVGGAGDGSCRAWGKTAKQGCVEFPVAGAAVFFDEGAGGGCVAFDD